MKSCAPYIPNCFLNKLHQLWIIMHGVPNTGFLHSLTVKSPVNQNPQILMDRSSQSEYCHATGLFTSEHL